MKQEFRLFLNGREVYFPDTPQILFTFQQTDLTNPTIVKNNFTKTVTIAGTQENNQIFNSIFSLDRTQSDKAVLFNPSQRVPFELYLNGSLIETGYAKLNTINEENGERNYEITLYGGLGDFLFNLTYTDEGEKRKLSDMIYTNKEDSQSELTFTINKETVREAWTHLRSGGGDDKWNVINFMPAYNGLPDNLDPKKILTNTKNFVSPLRQISGSTVSTTTGFPSTLNSSYHLYNGYGLATAYQDLTEWEVRDLRSYNQRPCLSLKRLLQAIANPKNNGGYNVVYDSKFVDYMNFNDWYRKG